MKKYIAKWLFNFGANVTNIEKVFKAFADKNRLRILKALEKKKMCVCELSYVLEITQPSISRHLKKLKNAGLINSEKNGFWTDYYLKGNNQYAKELLNGFSGWLNDDEVIRKDKERVKKADRNNLCHIKYTKIKS